MTVVTFERRATVAEIVQEMDRRGAVILRMEAERDRLSSFVAMIARLETSDEYDARTGDGMSGDDAVEALSDLIVRARKIVTSPTTSRSDLEVTE